jgi:hypothetical protein
MKSPASCLVPGVLSLADPITDIRDRQFGVEVRVRRSAMRRRLERR